MIGNALRRSRHIRCGHAALFKHIRPHRFVGPIDIGLRIVLLRDEAVHHAGALGLFGIEHRFHRDPGVALEVLEDRFRKSLVLTYVDHNGS